MAKRKKTDPLLLYAVALIRAHKMHEMAEGQLAEKEDLVRLTKVDLDKALKKMQGAVGKTVFDAESSDNDKGNYLIEVDGVKWHLVVTKYKYYAQPLQELKDG